MQVDTIGVRIAQVIVCLRGISSLGVLRSIPKAALVDLWHRVWPWIEFLDQYGDNLPGLDGLPATDRYALYMALFRIFRGDVRANKLMDWTSGSHLVTGRAWRYLIHTEEHEGFGDVSYVLAMWFKHEKWDPVAFEELVIGTGGTRMALASLVVAHLQRLVPHPDSVLTEQTLPHLVGILFLIGDCDGEWDLPCSSLEVAEIELKAIFSALVDDLACFPRHRWITESLRAGLLPLLFSYGSARQLRRGRGSLRYILKGILPPSTVYHSVLTELQISLVEVRNRDAAAAFEDPVILEHWVHFLELAEQRLQFMDLHSASFMPSMRACDDLECAKIGEKRKFKRCSGCSLAYYCSQTCQTNDWRRGAHRERCRRVSRDSSVSARDRSFLRALLHHDYAMRQEEITLDHLLLMKEHPGAALYTLFDYTDGSCKSETGLHNDLDAEWDTDVVRVADSGGRMQVHLLRVLDDATCRTLSFPLRSASAGIVQGLMAIADTLPPDSDPEDKELYRPVVQDLLKLDVQTIH
ncbi:hypothetical protein DFH06DRAFT_1208212 [Mycena polygramma]|nr:hypothetical protein DFH06DRAFT_1208212 [Mycena polygramma]